MACYDEPMRTYDNAKEAKISKKSLARSTHEHIYHPYQYIYRYILRILNDSLMVVYQDHEIPRFRY